MHDNHTQYVRLCNPYQQNYRRAIDYVNRPRLIYFLNWLRRSLKNDYRVDVQGLVLCFFKRSTDSPQIHKPQYPPLSGLVNASTSALCSFGPKFVDPENSARLVNIEIININIPKSMHVSYLKKLTPEFT
ncbi:hypothetical protein RIR_jg33389.t1 [Rhizophagus irregularis DAOM 181602=DAOM 197198]|nr:hypothetical protein RIR_jg33389.t1 [Rhizophagus irregularis DAOM 181602=DAOM 197198]